jgi:hypothetical protein
MYVKNKKICQSIKIINFNNLIIFYTDYIDFYTFLA